MDQVAKRLSLVFGAGVLGGLVSGLVMWFFGQRGITEALGVNMAPVLTQSWLYSHMMEWGFWGAVFLIPILKRSVFWRGILFSLAPTAVQLFLFFPSQPDKGWMGMNMGILAPVCVLGFNFIWGLVAASWMSLAKE